ncbi:hypothetical protein JB92DRAFT_3112182 [Gautieria morchelliformis]|nr:hypothetical protein JB92DRAFT_3112182 [Gautieria morchelliformis]
MPNGEQVDADLEGSHADSEIEAQEQQMKAKGSRCGQFTHYVVQLLTEEALKDLETLKKKPKEADAPREDGHTLPGWVWLPPGRCQRQTQPESPENKSVIKKVAGIDPKPRADHVKPPHASYHLGEEKLKNGVEYESGIPEADASSGC